MITSNPFSPASRRKSSINSCVRPVELNRRVRAQCMERAEYLLIAPRSHHASRAQDFGDLNCQLARDSGCTEDQHGFACGQLRAVLERKPRRNAWIGNSGGSSIVQFVRDRKTQRLTHHAYAPPSLRRVAVARQKTPASHPRVAPRHPIRKPQVDRADWQSASPLANCLSTGFNAAAQTLMSTSPSPGIGSGNSSKRGGFPSS